MKTTTSDWVMLAGFLAICFGAAALGGKFTASSVNTWYPTLQKPAWNPPGWVFGPVWTVLYILMAVAAWLVWRRLESAGARVALVLFVAQLVLNALWSYCFFGLRNPKAGFIEIVLLWVAIAGTTVAFARVSAVAGGLFLPYLLWVSFAVALNFTLWQLNPNSG